MEAVFEQGVRFEHAAGDDTLELTPAGNFFTSPRITVFNRRPDQSPHGGDHVINISKERAETLSKQLIDLQNDGSVSMASLLQVPENMVAIEEGWFPMGVDQEEVEQWARDRSLDTGAVLAILAASIPRHPVEVGAFLMDQFPVTEGEYRTFVLGEGYEEPSHWSDGFPQSRAQWPAWKSWKSRPRSIGSCTGLITKS
jgi:formylglycine-generating enzyme required for sulfatase activity